MAPGCALMPIRTTGMISDGTIDDLFEYARVNGADVISCSWGVADDFFTLSTRMKNAIRRAAVEGRRGKGCVILFAAGNENSPVDGFKNGVRVRSGFAMHPDVITVSASNSRDVRSHYSNFGPEIWVAAPSSGSGGRRIVTTDRTGAAGYQSGAYTTVEGFGGTSSSTPLAAGVCGLMLSVNPDLTGSEVKKILGETADKIDSHNGNYNPQGHSEWYGWGRVNAFKAVSEARNRLSPSPVKRITFERSPGLAVPDYPMPGVSDAIQVEDGGIVRSASVSVDITHTYRGDLRIVLVTPDGSHITLRDREVDSRDNLVHTYTADDTPALAGLSGTPARGSWELRVIDMAKIDTGAVNSWTLTLDLEPEGDTVIEATPGMHIPDSDPTGIVSEIQVDRQGTLKKIELTVDITHTWQGDLSVTLESPGGVSASIHQLTGGATHNLKRTWTASDTASLAALVNAGVPLLGAWKLHVSDHVSRDVGKLNAWKLVLGG
ncbi:MAG: S8 family serine peptidase [Desulfobacteraceae bacterium]|nr:S8 family serine peptidase [Desulfobacteraceae bacterium]